MSGILLFAFDFLINPATSSRLEIYRIKIVRSLLSNLIQIIKRPFRRRTVYVSCYFL